ncbi:MAG: hypothetical protein K9N47_04940 [Prosthecobacter sp.]|uniref:hypothetical protein n=1 Tax=Prosthecobacter sp. TaxID=1965333 RepID=UPI0025CE6144|nr:hypothetical protein [Prosthecobacter sp.]MCF7785445.1 hypothetical protein [Prosthecobacter sp.]
MKLPSLHPLVVLLVGLSLTLTACQYPNHAYAYDDLGRPVGYGFFRHQSTTGNSPLGALSCSVLGSNRDHYYYVIRGTDAGSRYYSARPYFSSTSPRYTSSTSRHPIYPISYQRHPYYSNYLYSSPYYNRSSSSIYSNTNRPWGGGYGFGQPFNWGSGMGLGSRWF